MNIEALLEASYMNAIRRFLQENKREYDGRIHVSHVLQCLRRSYYEIKAPPETVPNFNLFIGIGIHELIEAILVRELSEYCGMIRNVYYEVEISNGVCVGTPDLIIEFDDYRVVVDLKTTKYNLPNSKNKFAEKMLEKYIMQTVAYVHMTNSDFGILMFIKRQNGKPKFFRVERNDSIYREVISRCKRLKRALELNEEPEGEPDVFCEPYIDPKTGEKRGGCPFYDSCPYVRKLVKHEWW